ncbi:5349ab4f-4bfd-4b4d-8786-c763bfbf3eda [Thermothielavioides terrestris]|uniref:5349ab4f-4bfd-4b4d-8786-c763bfbf3eda n=1 Tax=Thermothielavioides terrestris TaxID=2587410 RepID=A0A3S4BBX5_9PEZI|nr:5349ab4f-4bfd-4b4d-8786-c763bfbf3eda [Thermothielavioides terrestris]
MSSTSPSSPPKRPRLSLQIKALANGPSGRTSRCLAAAVDVKSPTAFNTLSNVYATAVDRSTPVQENPPTAILGGRPVLRLQTQDVAANAKDRATPASYRGPYLDTPITAQPISPAVAGEICFPSAAMTATPPLSAQPPEKNGTQVFTFEASTPATAVLDAPRPLPPASQNTKRRTTMPAGSTKLPYTHPRSLRSILRNSPLPPLSSKSPESPRRQSLRLQEKAARRVAYNSPLTQEITTSKYTKSHIDLLAEDSTPTSISPETSSSDDGDNSLDQAMADAPGSDSTRDGGQTPGPFEEMRRRMANMHASTPVARSPTGSGIRKRSSKRREKKRRWVWTIGQDEEGEGESAVNTGAAAVPAKKDPAVSVPVLAVPAPRPRTRNQQALAQAQLAKAVAAATQTQVPVLAVPVPPARAAAAPATSAKTATTTPPSPLPKTTAPAPAPAVPRSPPPAPAPPREATPAPAPQPSPPHHPHLRPRQAGDLTPIPSSLLPTRHSTPDSSCSHSVRHLTPEPYSMSMSMSMHNRLPPMTMEDMFGGATATASAAANREGEDEEEAEAPTPSIESSTAASVCSSSCCCASTAGRDSVFDEHRPRSADAVGTGGDVEMSDASSVVVSASEDEGERDEEQGKGKGYALSKGSRGAGKGVYVRGALRGEDGWERDGEGAKDGDGDGDGDVEMDEGTPTMTARPVGDGFGGRGWVPWRDGGAVL